MTAGHLSLCLTCVRGPACCIAMPCECGGLHIIDRCAMYRERPEFTAMRTRSAFANELGARVMAQRREVP
jgi:hypothetical protein